MRSSRIVAVVVVFAFVLAVGIPPTMATDCRADIRVNRVRTDPDQIYTKHSFEIDISVPDACAVVEFNVLLETRKSGGATQTVKKYRKVKTRTQGTTTGWVYSSANDVDVLSWKAEQIECRRCQ